MKPTFKYRLLSLAIGIVLLLSSAFSVWRIADSSLFPMKYVLLVGAVCLILTLGAVLLTLDIRKIIRSILGGILAAVILAVQCIGVHYINVSTKTLGQISEPELEFSEVGVFVRNDDQAKNIADSVEYVYGILKLQDRDVTDYVLEKLQEELSKEIRIKEFEALDEMMNALLDSKEVGAILLNKAFLDLLEETEGHEEDITKIREIFSVHVPDDFGKKPETEEIVVPEYINQKIFTVYISGIDCFGKVTRKSRSDVNIIATVNTETRQILLVSTPRDYYVPLSISNGIKDKLTHAGIYGINCSRETLEMLYDTEIDYYFRLNFDGFQDIINELGGITVYSNYAFKTCGETYVKGWNEVNGRRALLFARERKSVPGGDRQRGKQQMEVIRAVIDKVTSPAMLTNYTSVMKSISGCFQTDMPYDKITKLIQDQLNNNTKWNIVSYSVDGTGTHAKTYSLSAKAYVMIPKTETVEKAKQLILATKNGEIPNP